MVYGIGIDMVDVPRFRAAMDRWGARLCARLFTPGELEYCMRQRRPERHLAARFAAKVSLFKALGRTLGFTEVEVIRGRDGRPAFKAAGIKDSMRLSLSISHDGALSVAQTIVEEV
ncbi:MAG: holo-ACP synthase [Thermodesulfobacteriota bacterium]